MNLSFFVENAHRDRAASSDASPLRDDDRLVYALRNPPVVPDWEKPGLARSIAELMSQATSNKVRNAAAILLTDLIGKRAADSMVEILRRPDVAKSSGSLLFALNDVEASLPLDLTAELVERGSLEAQGEALTFLEDGRIDAFTAHEFEAAENRLRAAAIEMGSPDSRHAAELALELMHRLHPTPSTAMSADPP